MLDQLVESQSHAGDNARRGGFLLTTMVVVVACALSAWSYDLLKRTPGLGGEDLELSSLVAPVPVPDEAPPPPEIKQEPEKTSQKTESILPTRTTNTARTDEPIAPDKIVTAPSSAKARPNTAFTLSNKDSEGVSSGNAPIDRGSGDGGGLVRNEEPKVEKKEEDVIPEKKKPTPTPTPKPPPQKISGGVLNGKAVSLPVPVYPPAARAVRASGQVQVQVLIDESGRVVSASAVSGNALLQSAAVQAARGARFSPTMLSGQAVKVSGIIIYNFTGQ
jgi:TonB family protein